MKAHGFSVNPYYRYIENSTINGKHCTIVWFVDDNKILHIYEEVKTKVIKIIAKHFGEITLSRGKKHKFLGMEIEFLVDGKLSLSMKDCIEESIYLFGS